VAKTVFAMKKRGLSAEGTKRKVEGKFAGCYKEGEMQCSEKNTDSVKML
jgi:hypothetical protein